MIPEFLASVSGNVAGQHAAWRYTLMSGLIPAMPLCLIRPFVPESPVWKRKRDAGVLRRPSFRELLGPELRRTTLLTTLMVACSYGAAWRAARAEVEATRRVSGVWASQSCLSRPGGHGRTVILRAVVIDASEMLDLEPRRHGHLARANHGERPAKCLDLSRFTGRPAENVQDCGRTSRVQCT